MEAYIEWQRVDRARELHGERLSEATQRRLSGTERGDATRRPSPGGQWNKMMRWVGAKLVIYGKRLQRQYS